MQYFISLLIVVLLLVRLHKRWATAFAIFAVVNVAHIAPFYLSPSEPDEVSAKRAIRALLLNVNSKYGDVGRTLALIQEVDPDLIVLAEINDRWIEPLETLEDSYATSAMIPRDDNFGIAVLSKLEMSEVEVSFIKPAEVPTVTGTVHAGDKNFSLIATQPLPPSGARHSNARNEQLRELARLADTAEPPVLLLGDLNVTPWSPHFRDLLQNGDLTNSMRGHGIQPSWSTWMPIFFIPIDHCLHGDRIRILDRRLGRYVRSDHLPVIVDFSIR